MSKQTKHTPAPWRWEHDELVGGSAKDAQDPDSYARGPDWLPQGRLIIQTDNGVCPPREFDRKLIAAAPDLLTACQTAQRELVMVLEAIERSKGSLQLGPKGKDRMLPSAVRVAANLVTAAIAKATK